MYLKTALKEPKSYDPQLYTKTHIHVFKERNKTQVLQVSRRKLYHLKRIHNTLCLIANHQSTET